MRFCRATPLMTPTDIAGATADACRAAKWARVHYAGRKTSTQPASNESVNLPVSSASHAQLGLTAGGKASAAPRTFQDGDQKRDTSGRRPTVPRGSVIFFDSTQPHRGPGRAIGEGRRTVLYLSWASAAAWALGEGLPVLAYPPPGGGAYVAAYRGKTLLMRTKETHMMKEEDPSSPKRAKRSVGGAGRAPARGDAAEALAGLSDGAAGTSAGPSGLDVLLDACGYESGEGEGEGEPCDDPPS